MSRKTSRSQKEVLAERSTESLECRIADFQLQCGEKNADLVSDVANLRKVPSSKDELCENHPHLSLDDLDSNIPQNFSVDIGTANFDCYFKDSDSDYLFVSLRSWRSPGERLYAFQRWTYSSFVNARFLAVNNPMYYYHPDLNTGYYIGSNDENYLEYLADIVKRIAKTCGIKNERIILFGSSSGGTAAIHCGYLIPGSFSVSINSQLLPDIIQGLKDNLSNSGIELSELEKERSDTGYCIENGSSRHLFISNIASSMDWEPLIRYCNRRGMHLHYGFNASEDNRFFVWLFEAYGVGKNGGHHAWENRPMMYAIEYVYKSIIERGFIDPLLPCIFSEFWFDRYELITRKEIEKQKAEMSPSRTSDEVVSSMEYTQENPLMLKFKADCYREGSVVSRDMEVAKKHLKAAAAIDKTYEEDLLKLEWAMSIRSEDQEVLALVKSLIDRHVSSGFAWMGRCCRDGRGVSKDLQSAADWYRKAVDRNVGWAKPEYFDVLWAIGTPESLAEMVSFARKESSKGDLDMRLRLAKAYSQGRGVDRDQVLAASLVKEVFSVDSGRSDLEYFDALWDLNLEETDAEMFDLASRLAGSGQKEIQLRLGRCYRDGRGTVKDIDAAIRWMRSAYDNPYLCIELITRSQQWDAEFREDLALLLGDFV